MQEEFLHYIWKYKKFNVLNLKTTQREALQIVSVGTHNHNSGPDFFNAQLRIETQLWVGNVEIHLKSSDWFAHHHEKDPAYDNVILHVVYEHDTEIFRADNSIIPTLELKGEVVKSVLENYRALMQNKNSWINCENNFTEIDHFVLNHWLERLYLERLERKSLAIEELLQMSKSNWEAVLFKMLAKNFGLKVNGEAFYRIATQTEFSVVRKSQFKQRTLEALFFGQAGLLEKDIQEVYFQELKNDYQFLSQKFQLNNQHIPPLQFFRLRPPNFPTIRLSQLANLYNKEHNLFSKVIQCHVLEEFYELFNVSTSTFWETHFTFGKISKSSRKTVTKSFIDLLVINTILPIKFCYAKRNGESIEDKIMPVIHAIASERNSIIDRFNNLKEVSKSALESQALIQLKNRILRQKQMFAMCHWQYTFKQINF